MKLVRLFISIDLTETIKNRIETEVEKLSREFEIPIRFMTRENWHLTLSFLGQQSPENIALITSAIEETARETTIPEIEFDAFRYGPHSDHKTHTPRMIWIDCTKETSDELGNIKASLEHNLEEQGIRFDREMRRYHGHITLARFPSAPTGSLPVIDRPFSEGFAPDGIDLMQSHLKRNGAEYERLSRVAFGL